ncbi:putative Zf-FLZ domain-containing protein [Helianthus anomalus]
MGNKLRHNPFLNCKTDPTIKKATLKGQEITIYDSLDPVEKYLYFRNQDLGNTPFCSQECRQEQIECDEARERRWKKMSSKKSTTETSKKSATVQTGTLVASN